MVPLGIMAVWGAYLVGSWGYCLLKGYDVSFLSWASPIHPYDGKWPPPDIPSGRVWPHSASWHKKGAAEQPETASEASASVTTGAL